MKKLLLLPVMLFGAMTLAMAQAPATTPAVDNPNGPEMKFDATDHVFGTIKQGDVATHEFRFKNTGKEPLIITSASGSCGCTVPDWPKDPIRPGGEGVIKVTFNSTGKMGNQDKTVTIISNAKEGTLVLHMKGSVEAKPTETAQPAPSGSGTPTAAPATIGTTKEAPKTGTTTTKEAPKTGTTTTKEAPKTVPAKVTPKDAKTTAPASSKTGSTDATKSNPK